MDRENQKYNPLDLTFIVNEDREKTLKDRFNQLIKDCKFFDCLVGYFYISGFYLIYKALETTEKIRIIIGVGTNPQTYNLIKSVEILSHSETKQIITQLLENEISESNDKIEVEEGVQKFIEWLKSGKLEIKAYPDRRIHAKLYIMTFREGDRDIGRVITGSSNLTQAGLVDNLEFNVELKNRADYEFAKQKFEELWEESVDVSESFVETLNEKTWLNQNITPYELYLQFLYEYFKDELSRTDEIFTRYLPTDFKSFEYQKQAVLNAKKILEEYGGVFISDVVGLGKTYIVAMLVKQLDGRTLVIAPPSLLDENNPGSWKNVFSDFGIHASFVSIGDLEKGQELIEKREYKNIVIDEAHRFRNEVTISYEKLSQICRGKRVILVSATPYNNSPRDILTQIKLFQNSKKSTIPGVANLESFFSKLETKLQAYRNIHDKYDKYIETSKRNSKEIREKVLKYLMVRRTRAEIEKYFAEDLKKNNVKFPEVKDPIPLYYQLSDEEDQIFMETIRLITQKFKYSRYTPLLYLSKGINHLEVQAQRNMSGFMKVLLVKRLESSFYAFNKSIDRFIYSYEKFIEQYKKGYVYISKRYTNKIFELLEYGDDQKIQKLIDEGKAQKYDSKNFKPDFENDLENDLKILKTIKSMWAKTTRDPKIQTLLFELKNNQILKNKKIIIFTESKETAEYLKENINKEFGEITLLFTGESRESNREKVIENFDARAKNKKDDYMILVSTEVLSEGVNLHRSNIVINYDIPWNPTRLIQRVGRVNRIDTKFKEIYVFNFFPTKQADSEIELTNIARSKIEAFLTLLGGDYAILTEGEPVSSHELFDKLISKQTIMEEEIEESDLKYLRIIENIRDNHPGLFEKIKRLPKKARTAKNISNTNISNIVTSDSLLTFFRKGKLMKFFISNKLETKELDFLSAAKILESSHNDKKAQLPIENYYELLNKNKNAFNNSTMEEIIPTFKHRDNTYELYKLLKLIQKNNKQLMEEQEEYIKKLLEQLEKGAIPKQIVKRTLKNIQETVKEIQASLNAQKVFNFSKLISKLISILQREIPSRFLEIHYSEIPTQTNRETEVILSLYLT